MTIYGTDMSHFDAAPAALGAQLVSEGFAFATHKAGGDKDDAELNAWWNAVRDHRDQLLLGAYWVLYPGSPVARADAFLARLDSQCPGWRGGPFILQADCEKWGGNPATMPHLADIQAFCQQLESRVPKFKPIVYASRGQYGNTLAGLGYPLWNADYPSGAAGTAAGLYLHAGGDSGPGWAAYSGQTAGVWQFTSSATIAGQTTCDANAFRGSLADLTALAAPGWSTDVELTDHVVDPTSGRDYGTLSGLLITVFNRTDAAVNRQLPGLASDVAALPTAEDNANAFTAALAAQSPQEIADALKVVLGDQAAAVGALLAAS